MYSWDSCRYWAQVVMLLVASYAPTVYSQTIQTPDTQEQRRALQQQEQERQRQVETPQVRLQEPAEQVVADELSIPAESPCFKINYLSLEVPVHFPAHILAVGASTLPQDHFRFAQDYLEKYAGQCIGREGLNLIVKRLTARILDKGYTTTRLGIPEQDLSAGRLKLTLVPGVIREIRFAQSGMTGSWRSAFPARPGDLLNLRDLEQGLEQMKRVPSQDADMQILPGDMPGESDVVIDLKRAKPWRFSASLDDTGAQGTGKLQAGLDLAIDNPFGINDSFSVSINNDADNNSGNRGTRGSSANYSMPWGNFTFTFSGGTSSYHQLIAGANQTFISSGKSDNLEFKTAYLFHRDQSSKSSIQFRTARRWSRAFIDDTEIAVQRRNNTLAELALMHKHYIGKAQLDVTAAFRWGAPWFGAQADAQNLPASSPSFLYNMQTIDATLSAPFEVSGKSLNYTGTFRAQYAKSPLYASEWFTIGNRWTVRGFDGESSLGAEKGFFLRNELGIPIYETAHAVYAGLDIGRVYGPNVQNLIGDKLAGAALGLRGSVFGGVTYDIFGSWALYKPQGMQTVQPAAGFSINYQM